MSDFELSKVVALIDLVRSWTKDDPSWMTPYLHLQSLFVYFQYAVSQVRIQEENLSFMEDGEHKHFPSHDLYVESELRIYSSALGAYAHMRTCLHFARQLSESRPNDQLLSDFRGKNESWACDLIGMRDVLQAHPNNEYALVWKSTMRSSDGRVEFPIRNLEIPKDSKKVIIHPRKDVDRLRSYLDELADHLKRVYVMNKSLV